MAKEIGVITMISGTVLVKSPDGKIREAKVGEVVHEGEIVMGTARLSLLDGSKGIDISGNVLLDQNVFSKEVPSAKEAAIQPQTTDTIVQALERGTDLNETLDATAAGLGGGGEGGGSSFVVLSRILERVIGNNYGYRFDPLGIPEITEGQGPEQSQTQQTTADTQPPTTGVPDTPTVPDTPNPPSPPEEPEDPEDPQDPEDPEDPVNPPKDHEDNGKGNGIDDAPGGSGDTKGDDADGSNTDGTKDTSGEKPEKDKDTTPEEENPKDDEEDQTEEPPTDTPDNGEDSEPDSEEPPDDTPETDDDGQPEVVPDEKDHQDNGKGNGVDDAPGNSGDTKGDDADGSNTPGTKDTLDPRDVLPDEDDIPLPGGKNNGFGNGDQSAPGNSGSHNGAENDISINLHQPNIEELLKQHGNPHYD